MKKFIILPLLFATLFGFAQKQFVVQNGSKTLTFEDINVAIATAEAGDTLYIPGGGFDINPNTIEKTLHWRGTGHHPDSTTATGASQITTSELFFSGDCDGSTFEGIAFSGTLKFGSSGNEATDITMKRCHTKNYIWLRKDDTENPALNFHMSQCLVSRPIYAQNGTNCLIEHSLIFERINGFQKSIFNHNIFSWYGSNSYNRLINTSHNCRFSNNVFTFYYNLYKSSLCNFQNNIFSGNLPYDPETSSFTGRKNITYVTRGTIFKIITTSDVHVFSYENDYHLNDSATGTDENGTAGVSIIGTATDGTNIGIYGGSMPYKEGAVPYNPHIRTVAIDDEATNGELGVKITVAAQER